MIRPDGRVREPQVALRQAVLGQLPRDQVAVGDEQLLLLGVAGQVDHLHPVGQGRGDGVEQVGRGDEHDPREVERHVQVVVGEGVVLLRVEHLQQGRGGIAAEVGADLVHLVEHEDRVVGARLVDAGDDLARQGADVGAPVAADLGLVAHAAQRDADELASQRPGDRLAERRLADPRRADEAEDRPLHLLLQLADAEVLEDPRLDLLEVVVVLR